MISDAVVEFLKVARSVAAGSCDAQGMPHGTRAAAVRIWPDREHVTLFLAESIAATTVRNARETRRLAIQISNPVDHRTLQLKGRVHDVRAAKPDEQAFIHEFVEELARVVEQLGMPFDRVVRMTHWPALAIDVRVEEIYLQTPGPGAGQPLAGRTP